MRLLPLPDKAQRLCEELHAPERLRRHLILVHGVAAQLVEEMLAWFPSLKLDPAAILLGAATHDLGKILHPAELFGLGRLHEIDGPGLLKRSGLPEVIARFAATHGTWESEQVALEDLLVALADNLWKGKREDKLEDRIVIEIATLTAREPWATFERIDTICGRLTGESDSRLRWQAMGAE